MKRIFLLALVATWCCYGNSFGQSEVAPQPPHYAITNQSGTTLSQVTNVMYANVFPYDTVEGGGRDNATTFRQLWQGRVYANGSSGPNMFRQYDYALHRATAARTACSGAGFHGAWQLAGPFNSPNVQATGYTNAIWVDPADSSYMLAGTIYGGLFKSTDAGGHWTNITDGAPIAGGMMGVMNIAVNPRNKDTIYVGTAGAAILESYDRGATWHQEFIPMGGDTINDITATSRIYITEDAARLYAIYDKKIYERRLSSTVWTDITPPLDPDSTYSWVQISFIPGNLDTFFVAGQRKQALYIVPGSIPPDTLPPMVQTGCIWQANDAAPVLSSHWQNITPTFVDTKWDMSCFCYREMPMDTSIELFKLSSPNNSDLFAISTPLPQPGGWGDLLKYHRATGTWTVLNQFLPDPNAAKFELIVSPANPNYMYYGSVGGRFSFDGGANWNTAFDVLHADIRNIYLQTATASDSGKSDRVYFATDGGVGQKPFGVRMSPSTNATDISGTGLACGTYWSFAVSDAGDQGIGGMMHDGVVTYEPSLSPQWENVGLSDAWWSAMDKTKPGKGYTWFWANDLRTSVAAHGREMDSIIKIPQPNMSQDPGYKGIVGKSIETDAFGNIYSVGSDFWRKTPTDTFVIQTYMGFPLRATESPLLYGAVIALNPNDTTFEGYVLYNTDNDNEQHIYYRNTAVSGFATADEVHDTIPRHSTTHINCIATDAYNTQRIWACMGYLNTNIYSDGTRYRVWYSEDHGTHWVDVSKGMPQLVPATRLTYDEATGIIYCSTDVGIFKCDFNAYNAGAAFTNSDGYKEDTSVQWECFNAGLISGHEFPSVSVTDLRISRHCGTKLYAATYGRSVWMTSIPDGTLTISHDLSLTGNQYLGGNIEIKPGVTFTINNDTLHMPKESLIIVDSGAHFIVNNSLLTNDCAACYWKGIEVRGHTGITQDVTSNQGWLQMTNSTVENARIAVANCNTIPALTFGSTGGIIQCQNSTFLNNQNAATFMVYDNYHSDGSLWPNRSYFTACNFIVNTNYRDITQKIDNFVYISGNEGIAFNGCNFSMSLSAMASTHHSVDGICSWNSGITADANVFYMPWISPYPYIVPCRFVGFSNAINVLGTFGYDAAVIVDRCDFDTVAVGVRVSKQGNVSVTRCNFAVGHGIPDTTTTGALSAGCGHNIGILSQNAATFIIEANNFKGRPKTGDWRNYGVVVANTNGENFNTVYRSTFDSLNDGVYSIGTNWKQHYAPGPLYPTGTLVSCNTFAYNDTDILAINDSGLVYPPQGLCPDQLPGGQLPNNVFSRNALGTGPSSVKHIANNVPPPFTISNRMNYAFCTCLPNPDDRPFLISPAINMWTFPSVYTNNCPTSIEDEGGGSPTGSAAAPAVVLNHYKADFYSNKASYTANIVTYNSRIDYGNTDSMVHYVDTVSSIGALYMTLLNDSPNVSKSVFKEVAYANPLPHSTMVSLLLQNSDNLRDGAFVAVVNSVYHFTSDERTLLNDAASNHTSRTDIETAIAAERLNMDIDANHILLHLKTPYNPSLTLADTVLPKCTDSTSVYYGVDSNAYYAGYDSIDRWLRNIGNMWTWYARAGYYYHSGQITVADSIMTAAASVVPPRTDVDSTDSMTYVTYSSVWSMLKTAATAGRGEFQLDSADIASLDPPDMPIVTYDAARQIIANLGTVGARISGGGVVSWGLPCGTYTTGTGSSGGFPSGRHGSNAPLPLPGDEDLPGNFAVYPNPTNGGVTFSYNVPDASDIHIIVTNLLGEKVMGQVTGNNKGKAYWKPMGLPSGIYIYQATGSKGIISKGKLVIVR
jgi:hypothetical protein